MLFRFARNTALFALGAALPVGAIAQAPASEGLVEFNATLHLGVPLHVDTDEPFGSFETVDDEETVNRGVRMVEVPAGLAERLRECPVFPDHTDLVYECVSEAIRKRANDEQESDRILTRSVRALNTRDIVESISGRMGHFIELDSRGGYQVLFNPNSFIAVDLEPELGLPIRVGPKWAGKVDRVNRWLVEGIASEPSGETLKERQGRLCFIGRKWICGDVARLAEGIYLLAAEPQDPRRSTVFFTTTVYRSDPLEFQMAPFDGGKYWKLASSLYRFLPDKDDPDRIYLEVPSSFVSDLTSTPWPFTLLVPKWGRHGRAAVTHDFMYWDQTCSKKVADKIMRLTMRIDDAPRWRVLLVRTALKLGGWYTYRKNGKRRSMAEPRFGDIETSSESWRQARGRLHQNLREVREHAAEVIATYPRSQRHGDDPRPELRAELRAILREARAVGELSVKRIKNIDELIKTILASEPMSYRADVFFALRAELEGYEELEQIVFDLVDEDNDIASIYRLGIDGWTSDGFRHLDVIRRDYTQACKYFEEVKPKKFVREKKGRGDA